MYSPDGGDKKTHVGVVNSSTHGNLTVGN